MKFFSRKKNRMARVVSVEPIENRLARCIEVDSDDKLFASGGEDGRSVVTHNSVMQRNIFLGCALRPESWMFAGIDLKIIEFSGLKRYGYVNLGVATTRSDALNLLNFAHGLMMSRYKYMNEYNETALARGVPEIRDFTDLPGVQKRLLISIDELAELVQSKEEGDLCAEINEKIPSILALGRAGGVHVVLATQRPSANIIDGDAKSNTSARLLAGRAANFSAAKMVLEDAAIEGLRVNSRVRGRGVVSLNNNPAHVQVFFAEPDMKEIDVFLSEVAGMDYSG